MEKTVDSRRSRGEATKSALMRAAEKLIAQHGLENVSIREIVAEAQQKNESALQYHFKNLSGLVQAIYEDRAKEVQDKRAEALKILLATSPKPSLRELCTLMVEPTFSLARANIDFRRYIKAFGHQLTLAETSPYRAISSQSGGGASGEQLGALLRSTLSQLDEDDFRRRMDAAIVLSAASMHRQSRSRSAFRGLQSDLFLAHLVDALFGLLSAPVSKETKELKRS